MLWNNDVSLQIHLLIIMQSIINLCIAINLIILYAYMIHSY